MWSGRSAVAILLAMMLAGCSVPGRDAASAGLLLYVANAADSTITQMDGASGSATVVPLPAGSTPEQVALGPNGSVLVLSHAATHAAKVFTISPSRGRWTARSVPVEVDGARQMLLAGDGGPMAAVAYHVPAGDENGISLVCHLALVDVLTGSVRRTESVCRRGELVKALAVESSPSATTVYVGIMKLAPNIASSGAVVNGRVVAIDARSGAVVATAPLAGAPAHVVLAGSSASPGRWLYVVEAAPGPDGDYAVGGWWRLLALDPVMLDMQREIALPYLPTGFVVAPGGDRAYALTPPDDTLRQVNLATGAESVLAKLPGAGLGLAIAGDRVYVTSPYGSEVWAVDRRRGQVVRTIHVGAHPVAMVVRGVLAPQ